MVEKPCDNKHRVCPSALVHTVYSGETHMAVLGRSTRGTIEAPVALHLTASFFEGFDVAMAGHAWAELYRKQLSRRYSRLAYDGA